jgi:hypothetical protein
MAHYLLTGAGFSRNWGCWLADEVFDYLLADPQLTLLKSELSFGERKTPTATTRMRLPFYDLARSSTAFYYPSSRGCLTE